MSNWLSLISIFVFSAGMFSCEKPDLKTADKQKPDVQFVLPENNFVYTQKDTVFIKAIFFDNVAIRKGSLHIHENETDTVFLYSFQDRMGIIDVDTFWIVDDDLDKTYSIYIDAIDNSENFAQKIRYFHQYH